MATAHPSSQQAARQPAVFERLPPQTFLLASAVVHYAGPACAVILFRYIDPLGVAWLRIAAAALIFAAWRRPLRHRRGLCASDKGVILALGISLAAMNCVFYEAIQRLPLGTVSGIELLGPISLAAAGTRTGRNITALVLAAAGVALLTDVRIAVAPLGYIFAFANCAIFMAYIVLGHRIAAGGGATGIDRLAAAMLIAMATALPFGIRAALPAFVSPALLLAAVGVGVSSSVVPYVCDQLAMARLPRATFALLLALLPATASVIGAVVLRQIPSAAELCGIVLVTLGVTVHRPDGPARGLSATTQVPGQGAPPAGVDRWRQDSNQT